MGKDRDNTSYDKERIKNRRDKSNKKRRDKRNSSQGEAPHKNDYRRRKQHDSEESRWDY